MIFEQLTTVMVDLQPSTLVTAYNATNTLLYRNIPVERVLRSAHKNDNIKRIGILHVIVDHGFVDYATAVSICVEEQ